ncbi:MAG: glycosyltransferase family 2 protein [Oligoflexales bacterium]
MPKLPSIDKNKVCIIIPAKDEAKNLPHFLPQLVQNYRVVLVDNLSSDGTAQIAQHLGAETIFCPTKGYGIAVQTGISKLLHASGQSALPHVLVILDADLSSPWEAIAKLTEPILSNKADFVLAQRTILEPGSMPWLAIMGNWIQARIINLLTGSSYQDMGPLRALSIDSYKKLCMQDKNWGWNVEMQIKAKMLGLRIEELPIRYAKRKFGESKISGNLKASLIVGTKILYSLCFYYFIGLDLSKSSRLETNKVIDQTQ